MLKARYWLAIAHGKVKKRIIKEIWLKQFQEELKCIIDEISEEFVHFNINMCHLKR
jgi:hypothetical protein